MKQLVLIFLCIILPLSMLAEVVPTHDVEIKKINNNITVLQQKIKSIQRDNAALKNKVIELTSKQEVLAIQLDSTKVQLLNVNTNAKKSANELDVRVRNADNKTSALTESVGSKTVVGLIVILLLAVVIVLIYLLLHRRINKSNIDIATIRGKADELNAKIVDHFSREMTELQNMSVAVATLSKETGQSGNNDEQNLIKTLADRITFMEMTLYRMDKKVRGYKQLTKSISQMKDNLLANGYEIVDMLDKPYNQGMKVTANFIEDESLEQGQQIITGVIKPQINYKGKMIQAAQITVSQNI